MKLAQSLLTGALLAFMNASPGVAQLDLGSDGTDGALLLTAGAGTVTLDVPEPEGIFNYTTIDIESGVTLRFNPNSLNTPVYMLATGDVNIAGAIEVNGRVGTSVPPSGGAGGPGGFAGGNPGFPGSPAGPGHGPGGAAPGGRASHNGLSGVEPNNPLNGVPYGSPLLVPLVGGSGGGGGEGNPGTGGGGGGGALLIGSNGEINITGRIDAFEGGPAQLSGSSGSIRLVAFKVSGNGLIRVQSVSGHGAVGRIRVDTIDRREMSLGFQPQSSLSVGAFLRIFADPPPSLALTHVAGQNIAEGATSPVVVVLPNNTPATQLVRVQARNFTGLLPIRVTLVPDSGNAVIQDATINMTTNPASIDLMMDFPINTAVSVEAHTR